jgi:SOS-response transcriptional repressor LexA
MASRALRRAPRELGYRGVQVLALIRSTIEAEGRAPSYAMIRDALGFMHEKHVSRVVQRLEGRGLVRRVGAGRIRRIRLVVNNGE